MGWIVFLWVARPLLIAIAFINLHRARIADPNRESVVRPLAGLVGLLSAVFVLLVVTTSAIGAAVADSGDSGATILGVIGALVGLVCLVPAVRLSIGQARRVAAATDGQTIRLAHYVEAPWGVRKSVRRILRSARTLRREQACALGLIDEKELQQLVYSSAQQGVLCAELNASIQDLRTSIKPADREAVQDAERRMSEIRSYLKDVERRLAKAERSARGISEAVAAPQQEIRSERMRVEAENAEEEKHRQARERLSRASLAFPPPQQQDVVSFEEKVSALHAGYQEVQDISDRAVNGPTLPSLEDPPADASDLTQDAKAIAMLSARWLAGVSRSAAKKGARKLRERMERNP